MRDVVYVVVREQGNPYDVSDVEDYACTRVVEWALDLADELDGVDGCWYYRVEARYNE